MVVKAVKLIHDMHTKSGAAEAIQEILPKESSKMMIEIAIDEWGPAAKARIQQIRAKLNTESDASH